MTEKKTSAIGPLLKAGREILIIVISILVAFALDAWWDLRQEAETAQRLVTDLAIEFDDVISSLESYIDRNNEVISAADSILQRVSAGREPVAVPSALVGRLILTPTLNPHQRNLEALVASGTLDLVRSDSLRVLLAVWPSAVEDVKEDEVAARTFVHEVLIPDLGALVDLGDPFRWRLEELEQRWYGWADEAETTDDKGGKSTVFISPGRQVTSLIQARRYLAAAANLTYRNLAGYAEEIASRLHVLAH